ncbi:hypothetical protein QYE76_057579 [Lolium multiflorum]|uniref:Uncharacterized protein n=1 Tax=Lolium multiflorum TaxID=4521 RepID=A0AAD8T5B1_LOLMU|nr:hypothetical protein QYE76_057579 [Lolium multiflorum]
MNPEAFSIDPKSLADDTSDTAESIHDDDADRAAFVDAAVEKADVLPAKRSSGGFADEDELFDLEEGFIEPPPKKAKTSSSKPAPAASEASAPATAPAAQVSTASSLSKGKEIPSTAVDFRSVISSLEVFASQFTSLEADKARLQKEVESSSSKLYSVIKIAAEARQNADSLEEELEKLKNKLKDEETSKLAAEAQKNEEESADISADALKKLPDNLPVDSLTLTLEYHKLIQALLQKNKGVMARMHSLIFPKVDQNKTLEQLIDTFSVDTKGVIEVFPVPSFTKDSSGSSYESDRLQCMKARIAQMEKDMRG